MLIHIPMSRKPININIHNMAKSEVYNIDCIEYMRTLPDNHFDIAVCDPPFGSANDDALIGGAKRFHKGGVFERYHKVEQAQRRTEGKILQASGHTGSVEGRGQRDTKSGGGRKQKLHNGTLHHHKSSLMSCSV